MKKLTIEALYEKWPQTLRRSNVASYGNIGKIEQFIKSVVVPEVRAEIMNVVNEQFDSLESLSQPPINGTIKIQKHIIAARRVILDS